MAIANLGPLKLHTSRVSHPAAEADSTPDFREIGSMGKSSYGGYFSVDEYNHALRGNRGLKVFDEMRRSDAQVRATLQLIKGPVTAAQWYVDPASDSQEDQDIAEFIEWNLHNMHRPWITFLKESLLHLDYGHYCFEKCFERGLWTPERKGGHTRPVVKWEKFASRHPVTIESFVRHPSTGEFTGIKHWRTRDNDARSVPISSTKLLMFTWDEEAGDPRGTSVLRSAYKHWYYKENLYKVDAIQKERHGIGIPRVKLGAGWKQEDKQIASEIGANLRTNEKAHIVELPTFEVDFIEMHGQPVNALASAEHHDLMIARNVLGNFINNSTAEGDKRTGSQIELFNKSLRSLGDHVRGVLNQYAIPELVDWNFDGVKKYPELRFRHIGDVVDWRTMSVALRNLVEPGIITPTPEMEAYLVDLMDFPTPAPEALSRPVKERILAMQPDDMQVTKQKGKDQIEAAKAQAQAFEARSDQQSKGSAGTIKSDKGDK